MSLRERILEAELRLLRLMTRSRCHRLNNHVTEASGYVALMQGASSEEIARRTEQLGGAWRDVADETRRLHETIRGAEATGPWSLTLLRDDLAALSENRDGALAAVRITGDDAWGGFWERRRDVATLVAFMVLEAMANEGSAPVVVAAEEAGAGAVPVLAMSCTGDLAGAAALADAGAHGAEHGLVLEVAVEEGRTAARLAT